MFVVVLVLLVGLIPATSASAAAPPFLWQAPPAGEETWGSEAGKLRYPSAVDTDPSTGHVFVVDTNNARISEFDVWGQFVKAWGWGVDDGQAEAQVCTTATGCQAGFEGAGPGQIARPRAVAVDEDSFVYVFERVAETGFFGELSFRLQKFTSSGEFVWMTGGEVNKTKSAEAGTTEAERNLCTKADLEAGDVCGTGVPGDGKGQFEATPVEGAPLGIGPTGNLLVGDVGRIQEFSPAGVFVREITQGLDGENVNGLAVDGAGNIYITLAFAFDVSKANVQKIGPLGEPLSTYEVANPRSITLDGDDRLYAAEEFQGGATRVLGFNADGSCFICKEDAFLKWDPASGDEINYEIPDLATNEACGIPGVNLIAALHERSHERDMIQAYGPAPDATLCPPPSVPPTIASQYAVSVGIDQAVVRADINPHFWPDTSFFVEYGTGKCSEGGCGLRQPVSGSLPLDRGGNAAAATPDVPLPGLSPNTIYHYRFVAQSGGGGPVVGTGPAEEEAAFTTRPSGLLSSPPCPNQAFRTGASKSLPDCRAYEMVTPIDKNNADIIALPNISNIAASFNRSAVDGNKLTFSAYRSFANGQGAPYSSQYVSRRDAASGWQTENITPAREINILPSGPTLDSEFKFFSPDLCSSWLLHDTDPVLALGAVDGFANLYRRQGCGKTAFEAITTTQPRDRPPTEFDPELQGVTADGQMTVFRVDDALTPDAPDVEKDQPLAYAAKEGQVRFICILPGGAASSTPCSAGTASPSVNNGRMHSVEHAVANDGSRVFWTRTNAGPGAIYVRLNPWATGTECEKKASPCTRFIGTGQFWTATPSGSDALITTNTGNMVLYDVNGQSGTVVGSQVSGVLGASEDLSRIYYLSEQQVNGQGEAGEQNLYLRENGTVKFIATLDPQDGRSLTLGKVQTPVNVEPPKHSARVSPDGAFLAFMSAARLTGYDNTDVNSGRADAQVFLYDATAGRLACVSCDPTGARPNGRDISGEGQPYWAAGRLPERKSQLYSPNLLFNDGRLFFETFSPLVPRDTNGNQDVYEFKPAIEAECAATGAELFLAGAGGCISLISPGEGAGESSLSESTFIDASASGSDVFIATNVSLVPQDPGLVDIYDARIGGGFAPPPPPPLPCGGEACQPPSSPPAAPQQPSSATFVGPGNPKPKCKKPKAKKRQQQAKKRQQLCKKSQAKKHGKKKHRKSKSRRAGR